ncbi:MAG: single-stranded-DNA-specific exonuclease RecJ [Spirochaetales bacterium]|nr:single-stranded-DNA-specific exonuclease RecJ [Spirochaetales bacterium]
MIWEKKYIDPLKVKEISRKYDIGLLEASILCRRNIIDDRAICYFLENDVRFLHNPFLFCDMEEAVDRILCAIESEEKIFVFGDRDVDGITSTVLLVRTLKRFGANVEWSLPTGDESYGLTADVVCSLIEKGVHLLITVDCGISNIDEIDSVKKRGIDTIVVDHHNPHEYLPDAVAVINPKVEESGYPFKELSGCAVTSKLIWALEFSKTRYYSRPVYLLHIRPANEAYIIEAIKLINLVEKERIIETIVPGIVEETKTRLFHFIGESEVCIFSAIDQQKQLEKVFGLNTSFTFFDISSFIFDAFPSLKGKSLLKIKEKSRIARYSEKALREIDVFKNLFISAIIKSEKDLSVEYLKEMDLIALGTLADVMPLVDENRIFVKTGLVLLNKAGRDGIRELIYKNDLHLKKINSKEVSWYITPVINASGRMGEPDKAARMLLSDDPDEAAELARYIIKLNEKRKSMGETAWNSVMPMAKKSFEETEKKIVFVSGKSIQRGITGIIAARLSKYFKVPALAIAIMENRAIGSMRSLNSVNAKDFLHHFHDLFTDFGGHDLAGGFTMPSGNLKDFENKFLEVVKNLTSLKQTEEALLIDAEIPYHYFTPDLYKVVELFRPYGEGNPPLLFLSKRVKLKNLELIGKKDMAHLRMLVETPKYRWPAVFWNSAERVDKEFSEGDIVDIVYNLSINYFQHTETLRLNILDIKRSKKDIL